MRPEMPLPVHPSERSLIHTRRIRFEGYKRADGLWDIDGHLSDIKTHDYDLESGVRKAGDPVHDMRLRLTIDSDLNILAAVAVLDAVPYPGGCDTIGPAYGQLVGLNLLRGFRAKARELLGKARGCTHLTELLGGFPTAAMQTLGGERRELRRQGVKPFQLDQCHALESSSETVRRYYPDWHRKPQDAA